MEFKSVVIATAMLFSGSVMAEAAVSGHDVLPRPTKVEVKQGELKVDKPFKIVRKVGGKGAPSSYKMIVGKRGVDIVAPDSVGLFYAEQTLQQLQELAGADGELAFQVIEDTPRFPHRGVMFDVSRHFRSIDFLKKQLDAMAALKLNVMHLHLTDGAGWRMEVDGYPRLTEYAAWRPQRRWADWVAGGAKYCDRNQQGAYGGYYTKQELRDLVKYAAERHITVIPEIEMPGHSDEVVAAYPEISCTGKGGDVCPGKEATFKFLESVLDQTMEIFPSGLIHIGGDEAAKGEWHNCPDCIKRMKDEGLKDVDELQSYLIKRIERYVNAHGRNIIGWDEILDGGVAPNATVMSWRGTQAGVRSLNEGHDVIMTPVGCCYIDYAQDAPFREPESIGGYTPLRKVYDYEPLEPGIDPEKASHLKGIQANLWVERVTEDSHAEYMYYPRVYAIAEIGWSTPEKNYDDFHRRALVYNGIMKSKGYNVFNLADEYGERPEYKTPLEHQARGAKVIYATPYSKKYSANGDTSLTDGALGGWSHGDGRWQGWTTDVDLTVDLGKIMPVHYAGASFMHSEGAWIQLPEHVTISVSTDGVTFKEVARIANDVDPTYPKIMVKNYGAPVSGEARFVRFQAKQNPRPGAWLFIDELVVN